MINKNLPLGDVHGWWPGTNGKYPGNYRAWRSQYTGNVPGMSPLYRFFVKVDDFLKVLSQAFRKPWPDDIHPLGIMVDADVHVVAPLIGDESGRAEESNCGSSEGLCNIDGRLEVSELEKCI